MSKDPPAWTYGSVSGRRASGVLYGKVECDLFADFVYPGVETRLFIRVDFIGEGSGAHGRWRERRENGGEENGEGQGKDCCRPSYHHHHHNSSSSPREPEVDQEKVWMSSRRPILLRGCPMPTYKDCNLAYCKMNPVSTGAHVMIHTFSLGLVYFVEMGFQLRQLSTFPKNNDTDPNPGCLKKHQKTPIKSMCG